MEWISEMTQKRISKKQDTCKTPVYKKKYNELTPSEKSQRKDFLEILSDSRNTRHSLTKLVREKNKSLSTGSRIKVKDVIDGTNSYRKIRGRWKPKRQDRLSVPKTIFENGKERSILTSDSRTRSQIGKYLNSVKRLKNKGDTKGLKKFRNKTVRDSNGKKHRLETNSKKILEIFERTEDIELRELY